jgi:pullulanase/glycogen debranching enzyme
LAVNPAHRLDEFEALIARTHKAGLKLIIDIVPNHIARKYEGKNNLKELEILVLTMIKRLNMQRQ